MLKDKKLAKRIKQGDLGTFERLFRNYYAPLCGFANKYLEDMDTAEEIVQDVYYVLWEKRDEVDIDTSLKSYIYKSVYNKCLMHIRHEKVKQKHAKEMEYDMYSNNYETKELYNQRELQEIISKTMQKLPERCRNVFRMNRFEGLKYKEIAEILSLSIKTIEADMGKALKVFREALKEYVVADN